jgi:hypothetical protein
MRDPSVCVLRAGCLDECLKGDLVIGPGEKLNKCLMRVVGLCGMLSKALRSKSCLCGFVGLGIAATLPYYGMTVLVFYVQG